MWVVRIANTLFYKKLCNNNIVDYGAGIDWNVSKFLTLLKKPTNLWIVSTRYKPSLNFTGFAKSIICQDLKINVEVNFCNFCFEYEKKCKSYANQMIEWIIFLAN